VAAASSIPLSFLVGYVRLLLRTSEYIRFSKRDS
jgi:hypothetical protein